jgi:hypothetical protein
LKKININFNKKLKTFIKFREKEPKLFDIQINDYKIKWSFIAMEMNQRSMNRTKEWMGKHCRERWFNHLNPNLKR